MYRILSLDGGGVRGLLATRLLEKIAQRQPQFWEKFDLIAGTSTGAIPALGLAAGLTPHDLSDVYQRSCELVFRDGVVDNLRDGFSAWGAQYSHEGLKEVLQGLFGDKRLGDLNKKVLVPTVDLDNKPTNAQRIRQWKAKFFHNFEENGSDADELVVDVIMRSTSAPVFFPIYQGYVDGGLVANNPSMCALVQVLNQKQMGHSLNDLIMLSVGTGKNPKFIPDEDGDWGFSQWAFRPKSDLQPALRLPLLEMMFETSIGLADFQCQQILGDRYHRLDPVLAKAIDLDDDKQIGRLNQAAGRIDIDSTIAWVGDCLM
ncbi:MAG: patatin-like phospholipase family protein [Chloroflexota bacterium]